MVNRSALTTPSCRRRRRRRRVRRRYLSIFAAARSRHATPTPPPRPPPAGVRQWHRLRQMRLRSGCLPTQLPLHDRTPAQWWGSGGGRSAARRRRWRRGAGGQQPQGACPSWLWRRCMCPWVGGTARCAVLLLATEEHCHRRPFPSPCATATCSSPQQQQQQQGRGCMWAPRRPPTSVRLTSPTQ